MALARTRRFFNHTLVTSLTPEFLLGSNFGKSARPLCLRIDVTRRALGSDGCSLCWRLVRHFFNTWEFPCFWQISTLFSLAYSTSISDILKVRLGEYDVSTTAEPLRHEEINVTEIHIHPDFNNSTLMHDIALLKLEKPAKRKQAKKSSRSYTMSLLTEHFYSQNIDVVCMPKQGDFQYQDKNLNCYITGWGRRAESNWYFLQLNFVFAKDINFTFLSTATEHSLVLKEIKVPLWDHANCNDALQTQFGPAYVLPPSSLCAGAEGHDACDVNLVLLFKNLNWLIKREKIF